MDAARPPTARSLGDSPEEAFRRLFRDLACICGFDGTLHWVSPNWTEVLGHLPSDPLSRRYLTYIHPEDREATLTAIRGAASSLRLLDHLENRVVTPDGSYRWLQWSHEVDHEAETIYAVARDITERKHTELRLAASEARYRLLADHSTDAITVSSSEGAFTYVSPSGREIFGWEPEQLIGKDIYTFIHADDVEGLRASLSAMLSDPGVVTLVARFRRADDSYRWLESTGQQILDPDTGELTAVIGNTRDITERQRVQADLLRQAVTDPLTGVANRILLMDRIRGALLRLDRAPGLVAVVMLDLDRFKGVNDTLGHDAGDAVLIEAARRLQSVCRVSDSVARLGGDEFVVLAEGLSTVEDVDGLARRLGGVLREPFHVDRAGDGRAHSRVVTASIGIAMTGWHAHRPEDLMRGADLALYRAKSGGRDRHELFDADLEASALLRSGTEHMLRRALADQHVLLRFQPVVRITDQKIMGTEALVRIIDGSGAEVLPGEFLYVAEHTGLIRELDAWVMRRALSYQSGFAKIDPTLSISVKVSTRNLGDQWFAEHLTTSLADSGVPASAVMLEMTERVLMQTTQSALAGLRRLRKLGVRVGVDDFGTGYASLAWLREFPLDFLKIDRDFVQQASTGGASVAILQAIVDLARALSLTVITEGIENPHQLAVVQEVGCDYGQGRLFSQPLSAGDYELLLSSRQGHRPVVARDAPQPPSPRSRLSESNRRPIHYE